MERIQFHYSSEKLLEIVVYILKKIKKADYHKICKIIFYADKTHLNKYWCPISGDIYVKMNNGPVPSKIYDIIKKDKINNEEQFFKKIDKTFEKEEPYYLKLKKNVKFNGELFSQSNLEEIDKAIELCKNKTFNQLTAETHKEKSWLNALLNSEMNFEDFIDDDNKDKENIIKYLKEEGYMYEV